LVDRRHGLVEINDKLQQKQTELDTARQQLAGLTEYKRVTPRLYWKTPGIRERLGTLDKRDNEPNELTSNKPIEDTVYAQLRLRASELYVETNALIHRAAQLAEEISDTRAVSAKTSPSTNATEIESYSPVDIEVLVKRNEELGRILDDRRRGLTTLLRQEEQELDDLARARDAQLNSLDQEIVLIQAFHNQLHENANQAALARNQLDIKDIRLVAPAAIPEHPLPRGSSIKAILAASLAGMAGLLVALTRDVRRQERISNTVKPR